MAALVRELAPLISPLVAVAITLFFTNRREVGRMRQEQRVQLRDERLKAYSHLARVTNSVNAEDDPKQRLVDVSEAMSEVELLADDEELVRRARNLADAWTSALDEAQKEWDRGNAEPFEVEKVASAMDRGKASRKAFLDLAKAEREFPLLRRSPWWRRLLGD